MPEPLPPPATATAAALSRPAAGLADTVLPLLLTALVYFVVGVTALKVAVAPGFASPLYPPAGIALAAVLVYGRSAVVGVVLGSFAVNLSLSSARGNLEIAALALPAVIALGSAAQAWLGARLVGRFAQQPLRLSEPRDIAVFYGLGGLLSCMVACTVATAALGLSGTVPRASLPTTWFTWWAGDTLGAMIAAPIALTLIGRPRADWVSRRLTVGLTLALVTLVMALGVAKVARWDEERLRNTFTREAANAGAAVEARLREPLMALEALRGVFVASDDVSRQEFRRATAAWLANGNLQAVGWHERVRRDAVPAFETRTRNEGIEGFRVFDRIDAASAPLSASADVLAMRFVEPMAFNERALGLNVLSISAAAPAIQASIRGDRAVASEAFELTQDLGKGQHTGVVIYRGIYTGSPATPEGRESTLQGVVFATLRPQVLLERLGAQFPDYLAICMVDVSRTGLRQHLAGPTGCESMPAELSHIRRVEFADRSWDVVVSARADSLPEARDSNAWLFSLVGLLGASMLGALLLTVTGRTRRIEAAVRERTAALESEVQERERAQAALRDSEQRFRNILNNVPIGVIYTDLRGNVKQANPRFCELTGYSEEELLMMSSAQYTHPDDVMQEVVLTERLLKGEIPMYRLQKRYLTRDGRTAWGQATVTLLRDEQGQPRRVVGVVEDIAEHLRLQEAEKARDSAEAANRAKSEFLSRMSHELRTPLNAMLGFAQLLELDRRHPLATEQRPWVTQIQQAGWHLLEMINDVLDLSRIESGNLKLQIAPLNLPDLLNATLSMVNADAQRRRLRISTELAPGTGVLLGDATRVKQILTNLLTNAVKYNSDGGRIHVATRLRGADQIELAVTDTGLGMTAQQMSELFQPFNRLGRERSSQEGTGIGLVISQRLAELMGGSLRARSIAGEGSSFILALPKAVEPDTVRSDLSELSPTAAGYHRRIVHYVEDNETNVEVMRGILSQRPQVQLEVTMNGLDGLAAIRRQMPDLVLLDMHLPDMSGEALLGQLKADPLTAAIPVVVVSADATDQQIAAAFDLGARRYLTKPVSVTELLTVVDDLLLQVDTRFG